MSETTTPTHLYYEELPSTNSQLRSLIFAQPLPPFSVVQAEFQNAGRGQEGNRWESARGENLLFSILVRPKQLLARNQFYLSKAISVAIVESLNKIAQGFQIKWPNDIYHGDKKVAGILIENNLNREYIDFSIVGIGINVNQTEFLSDAPNPISLKQITKANHQPAKVLATITDAIEQWIEKLNNRKTDEIDAAYNRQLYRSNGTYPFRDKEGSFEAALERIEPEGYLVLRDTQNQIRSYAFKEVSYIIS
ncbi:MAG: biotin--[acetyl-CoA-carboxylase] ligase [Marinilabiliaceae bacterium]|nr:biotin--[acetyl-CoA-carboxylase] ligase [Marinilabiliaceae bacterium]